MRVDVVHVILDVVSGTMPFSQATVEPGANPGIRDAAARAPGLDVQERVLFGESAVHAILDYARETNPDLLVTGSHGRGAIARAPVEHHRHLSEKELGAFWRKLDEQGARPESQFHVEELLARLGAEPAGAS